MKRRVFLSKYISITVVLILAILFVAKFGGPSILKLYIETGIGSCQKMPIFCMAPEKTIINPEVKREYIAELIPYKFPKLEICIPEKFLVVQEKIKKVYYKKGKPQPTQSIVYLLYEEPDFFVNLFPQLKKQGIVDNYNFIKRTMSAKLKDIKNLTDAFFVIMKGIFSPDIGDQKNVKMLQFIIADKKGFINYNLTKTNNYFDCNVINRQGDFFKLYIKDTGARLNLDKVLAIISTVNRAK